MNHHTALGLGTPLLKTDSPRRIDRVIDYFGEARPPGSSGAMRAPESTGDVTASQRRVIQRDE
jgi:hypothetical protein